MRINLLHEMIHSAESQQNKFTPRIIIQYHDLLLFILAYPPDKKTQKLATAELNRLAVLLPELVNTSTRAFKTFRETGVLASTNEVAFSWSFLRWFTKHFPDQLEIVWDENESAGPALDNFLNLITQTTERDGLLDSSISTREWFNFARGSSNQTALSLLVERIDKLNLPDPVTEHLFDALDFRFDWTIKDAGASRTGCRFPDRGVFYHRSDLLRYFPIDKYLHKKIPAGILPKSKATNLIETARYILGSRARETDPVTFANPDEVYLANLDRGIDIALYGMTPKHRLPIESFFGYILTKNQIPAAYGGGWVFLDRCEIGINIFPEMRGGESAYLFTQLLRLYRDVFNIQRFTVDPFQFGADNKDGLRSGAFWFYRRFGFEPIDGELRDLANREWEKILSDGSYRSPLRVLKKLAKAKLVMEVGDGGEVENGEVRLSTPDLPTIGLTVTRRIGLQFGGDLQRAEESSFRWLLKILGIRKSNFNNWPEGERAALMRFAPLVMLIDDLEDWPMKDQRSLITLLRSKGGKREMRYTQLARNHPQWGRSLRKIAEDGNPDETGAE